MELCIYCNKPMVLATESRGYRTYRCKMGCPCYRSVEMSAQKPDNASSALPAQMNLRSAQREVVTV